MSDELRGLVTVKPLEWDGTAADCYMFADTMLGRYECGVEYGDEWYCDFTSHATGRPIRICGLKDGQVVPISAAQSDYEARIFAALTPTPNPQEQERNDE